MNKIKIFIACCVIAFSTIGLASDYQKPLKEMARKEKVQIEKTQEEKVQIKKTQEEMVQEAVLLINHINWVVSNITNYNNVIVLEEEYESISINDLVLTSINDDVTITLIRKIMRTIKDARINEGDRKILQEVYDIETANAIYDSIPPVSTIISPNILSLSINLIQSSASSYANFKRIQGQLSMRLKKDTWDLDKDKLKYLNDLNEELLQQQWELTKRYNFPDYWRVSPKDITTLIDRLKDDNNQLFYGRFELVFN